MRHAQKRTVTKRTVTKRTFHKTSTVQSLVCLLAGAAAAAAASEPVLTLDAVMLPPAGAAVSGFEVREGPLAAGPSRTEGGRA